MAPSGEVQAETLQKFLDAWAAWDFDAWRQTFDENFTQVTMPFNMNVPERTLEEVEHALPKLMEMVDDYELNIHEVVHEASKNKAAVYATSKGSSRFGPWNMEYAAFVHFNEQGDKVARVEEMLDSAFLQDFGPRFSSYLAERNQNNGPVE